MTTDRYGPQTPQVTALVARIGTLTIDETTRLATAWDTTGDALDAALDAAWDAVRDARVVAWAAALDAFDDALDALDDAWYAVRFDAWYAARDASLALVVRDLIPREHYDVLTTPWRQVVGPIHPDDPGEVT